MRSADFKSNRAYVSRLDQDTWASQRLGSVDGEVLMSQADFVSWPLVPFDEISAEEGLTVTSLLNASGATPAMLPLNSRP